MTERPSATIENGRYILNDETGKPKSYQRVTNFCGSISDSYGLEKWRKNTLLKGLILDPKLYTKLQGCGNTKQLDEVADEAFETGGGLVAANTGTRYHTLTELADVAEPYDSVDGQPTTGPEFADVIAYKQALGSAGVEIIPNLIERIVCVDGFGVAGTFDRIVKFEGEYYIADLKTGRDPVGNPHSICIQLACYANADAMFEYDAAKEVWNRAEMPLVNKERGLVIHIRPGSNKCELWWFDLKSGWYAAQLCQTVKEWKGTRGLVTKLGDVTTPQQEVVDTILGPVTQDVKPPLDVGTIAQQTHKNSHVCADCGNAVDPGFVELSKFKFDAVLCPVDYREHLKALKSAA